MPLLDLLAATNAAHVSDDKFAQLMELNSQARRETILCFAIKAYYMALHNNNVDPATGLKMSDAIAIHTDLSYKQFWYRLRVFNPEQVQKDATRKLENEKTKRENHELMERENKRQAEVKREALYLKAESQVLSVVMDGRACVDDLEIDGDIMKLILKRHHAKLVRDGDDKAFVEIPKEHLQPSTPPVIGEPILTESQKAKAKALADKSQAVLSDSVLHFTPAITGYELNGTTHTRGQNNPNFVRRDGHLFYECQLEDTEEPTVEA